MVASRRAIFRLDAKGLQKALAKSEHDMFWAARRALDASSRRLDRIMQKDQLRPPGLHRRSGRLATSFTREVVGHNMATLLMRYGTNVSYAAIHEFGGIVKPIRGKWLTIPLKLNKTPDGQMRQSLRSFPVVKFVRSKKGRRQLIALAGPDAEHLKPMFVLVREVKIPARLGLRRQWIYERRRLMVDLNSEIRKVLKA